MATKEMVNKPIYWLGFLVYEDRVRMGIKKALRQVRKAGIDLKVITGDFQETAVQVMKELGIDISGQRSKSAEELGDIVFNLAITVCERAKEACPICSIDLDLPSRAPKAREVVHKSFEDPAAVTGSEEKQLRAFRRARDEIKEWIVERFG